MAIKDMLPRLRRERGLTQEELAKRLFITRQAVGTLGERCHDAGYRHDQTHRARARRPHHRAP